MHDPEDDYGSGRTSATGCASSRRRETTLSPRSGARSQQVPMASDPQRIGTPRHSSALPLLGPPRLAIVRILRSNPLIFSTSLAVALFIISSVPMPLPSLSSIPAIFLASSASESVLVSGSSSSSMTQEQILAQGIENERLEKEIMSRITRESAIETPSEWEQRVHEQVDWAPGPGIWNLSAFCQNALDKRLLPRFANSKTYQGYLQQRQEDSRAREIDLRHIIDFIRTSNQTLRPCLRYGAHNVYKPFEMAFRSFFEGIGINMTIFNKDLDVDEMKQCDIIIRKGMRSVGKAKSTRKAAAPPTILWELPMIWRTDPVNPNRLWSFMGWDYLNGYAMPPMDMPDDRWKHYFAGNAPVAQWIEAKPDGYALILGQVPSDTAIIGAVTRYNADVYSIYRMAIASIRAEMPALPIKFRPHPLESTKNNHCADADRSLPPGVMIRTEEDETLEEAFRGAAVVVAITSSAAVESVLLGIPTITLDYESPSYEVTCHSFQHLRAIVNGTACRPLRDQWLYNLAYTLWTVDDIASGNLFRYLFGLGPQRLSSDKGAATISF